MTSSMRRGRRGVHHVVSIVRRGRHGSLGIVPTIALLLLLSSVGRRRRRVTGRSHHVFHGRRVGLFRLMLLLHVVGHGLTVGRGRRRRLIMVVMMMKKRRWLLSIRRRRSVGIMIVRSRIRSGSVLIHMSRINRRLGHDNRCMIRRSGHIRFFFGFHCKIVVVVVIRGGNIQGVGIAVFGIVSSFGTERLRDATQSERCSRARGKETSSFGSRRLSRCHGSVVVAIVVVSGSS